MRIAGWVRRTPVMEIEPEMFGPAGAVALKLEFMQHCGSFKVRGAFNRILAAAQASELPRTGVIAASGGNAGLAVAYAAHTLNLPAEVYVPITAPTVKVTQLRKLGATVRQVGVDYAHAYGAAIQRAADTGALFCHAYTSQRSPPGRARWRWNCSTSSRADWIPWCSPSGAAA